jgi:hypothetical protein
MQKNCRSRNHHRKEKNVSRQNKCQSIDEVGLSHRLTLASQKAGK